MVDLEPENQASHWQNHHCASSHKSVTPLNLGSLFKKAIQGEEWVGHIESGIDVCTLPHVN